MTRLVLVCAAAAAGALLLAGCGSRTSEDAIEVVKDYYAAINTGDVDTAMTYVARQALFANPTGVYRGAGAIRTFIESSTGITQELSNFRAKGGRVAYDYRVVKKATGEVLDEGTDGLTVVRHRQIVFDGTEADEGGGGGG